MTVYKNATIIQLHPPVIRPNVDLVIQNGVLIAVGRHQAARHEDIEAIDLEGALVMPGLVCAHTHLYSILVRGVTTPIETSYDFVSVLRNLWWRLDRAIDEETLYASAVVGAIEAVRVGTTSIVDHHSSPNYIAGSLDIIRNALAEIGVRGVLCYEVTDRNGPEGANRGVQENMRFVHSLSKKPERHLIEATIGAHAPFTLSGETLILLEDAVRTTRKGIHIHVAEDAYDSSHSHHCYGLDIAERLDRFHLLDDKTICVHGVNLGSDDVRLLNERQSFLIHNPRSNMNNRVGYAKPVHSAHHQALGTDGIGFDMFEEAKFAYFTARDANMDINPADTVRILQNGNTLLERCFDERFGQLEEGYQADFLVLDYASPTPLTEDNIAEHFLYGMSARDIRSVVIGGVPVYTDGKFSLDITSIYHRARLCAQKLWDRMRDVH